MGNSPSADLGGGSTHSSRDVRTTNPEMEVKRSSASRAPTHDEYNELPASSKPHTLLMFLSHFFLFFVALFWRLIANKLCYVFGCFIGTILLPLTLWAFVIKFAWLAPAYNDMEKECVATIKVIQRR